MESPHGFGVKETPLHAPRTQPRAVPMPLPMAAHSKPRLFAQPGAEGGTKALCFILATLFPSSFHLCKQTNNNTTLLGSSSPQGTSAPGSQQRCCVDAQHPGQAVAQPLSTTYSNTPTAPAHGSSHNASLGTGSVLTERAEARGRPDPHHHPPTSCSPPGGSLLAWHLLRHGRAAHALLFLGSCARGSSGCSCTARGCWLGDGHPWQHRTLLQAGNQWGCPPAPK